VPGKLLGKIEEIKVVSGSKPFFAHDVLIIMMESAQAHAEIVRGLHA